MSDKYKNKYRIASIRLPDYDYTLPGMYFVTICTKNRQCFFANNEIKLSNIGRIAHQYWAEIPQHFSNVSLDEFVVMPNHVHGVIIINNPTELPDANVETLQCNVCTDMLQCNAETLQCNVCTDANKNTDENKNKYFAGISPKPKSLGAIIRSYKSICTKMIHLIGISNFAWQPRFYECVIRNDISLERIRKYIQQNPANWANDKIYR